MRRLERNMRERQDSGGLPASGSRDQRAKGRRFGVKRHVAQESDMSSRELETQIYSELKEGGLWAAGSEADKDPRRGSAKSAATLHGVSQEGLAPEGEPGEAWESEGSVSATSQGRGSCPERDGTSATSRERAGREGAGSGPSLGLHRRGPPTTAEWSHRPEDAEALPA